jgi:membrane protease YdiL (CAAX protease family)
VQVSLRGGTEIDRIMALLLIVSIIVIQIFTGTVFAVLFCTISTVLLAAVSKERKPIASTILSLVIGFYLAKYVSTSIIEYTLQTSSSYPLAWSLSRLGLVGYLVIFALTTYWLPFQTNMLSVGSLSLRIPMPLTSGRITDPIWRVLLFAIIANIAVFSWIIDWGKLIVQPVEWFLFGLLFAAINSSMETVLWRGFVFSRCLDAFGVRWGIILSGAAFGLYHYSFMHDWTLSILFGFGGIALNWLAWKSRGLLAAGFLHFVLNVLFVLSGMIFGYYSDYFS